MPQKWAKIRYFNVDFFENFSGGIAPRPPYWGGATAPLPRPHPPRRFGASCLRASLGTFGPSIDAPPHFHISKYATGVVVLCSVR